MISDYIEALINKKQKLLALAENETLTSVLNSTFGINGDSKSNFIQQLDIEIKSVSFELESAFNQRSELDDGTQFKIFDRVQGGIADIDPEERALDQLMNLINIEKMRADSESK